MHNEILGLFEILKRDPTDLVQNNKRVKIRPKYRCPKMYQKRFYSMFQFFIHISPDTTLNKLLEVFDKLSENEDTLQNLWKSADFNDTVIIFLF